MRTILVVVAAVALAFAERARAADEAFELWFNPAFVLGVNDRGTSLELETAQRFRDGDDGRVDTYFARGWVNQDVGDYLTVSAAVEQRINDGGPEETRLHQQLSGKYDLLRTRLRLEERFVDGADNVGLRLRPRLGVSVPIADEGRWDGWSFKTDAELFLTLEPNNDGGDHGLTGLRTQIGFEYDVSETLSVSLVYLRQQDFEDDGPDQIGHAPLIGVEFRF